MTTTFIKANDYLTNWCESACPRHGFEIRKSYSFGKYADATVYTFKGCDCAVCVNEASLLIGVPTGHEFTMHDSYAQASGRARLISASEAVKNAPFGG